MVLWVANRKIYGGHCCTIEVGASTKVILAPR